MEQLFSEQKAQTVKEARWRHLMESLANRRLVEKCDVILVCGDKEFPVHKLIMEASSPYFEAMFHSGLEEAKSGRVLFREMQPDTLDAILDFLYLGSVDKIKTEEQVKRILAASHMMHLEQLSQYCCEGLCKVISLHNVIEIWDIAKKYDKPDMQMKVLNYWIMNAAKLVTTPQFLCMTIHQMKDFVCFLTSKLQCLDKVLLAIMNWLRHDLADRDKFCSVLFACIEAKRLSKLCMTGVLHDKSATTLTAEISNRLKDLAVEVLLNSSDTFCGSITGNPLIDNIIPSENSKKITFFNDYYAKEEFDPKQLCTTKREENCCCVQQFNLDTMMWLPLQKVPIKQIGSAAMCQFGHHIYMVGGSLGSVCAMYDVQQNLVEYVACSKITGRQGARMCCFKDHLYVVGGKIIGESMPCVHFAKPGSDEWFETNSLTTSDHQNFTNVLSSAEYIYIASAKSPNEYIIEYSARSEVDHYAWKSISVPNVGELMHLFVFNNTLYCLYCDVNSLVTLRYNHQTNRWLAKQYPKPQEVKQISSVAQCPDNQSTFVFLTTEPSNVGIPHFLWEPETGKWTKLPPPKGQRTILDNNSLLKVYTIGI